MSSSSINAVGLPTLPVGPISNIEPSGPLQQSDFRLCQSQGKGTDCCIAAEAGYGLMVKNWWRTQRPAFPSSTRAAAITRQATLLLQPLEVPAERFQLALQAIDMVEQIEGHGEAGEVDAEIATEAERLARAHDRDGGEAPDRGRVSLRLDDALLDHLHQVVGVDAADRAKLLEVDLRGFVDEFAGESLGFACHLSELRAVRVG